MLLEEKVRSVLVKCLNNQIGLYQKVSINFNILVLDFDKIVLIAIPLITIVISPITIVITR